MIRHWFHYLILAYVFYLCDCVNGNHRIGRLVALIRRWSQNRAVSLNQQARKRELFHKFLLLPGTDN